MANSPSILHSRYSILIVCISILCASADIDRKVHIVYMGSLPKVDYSPSSHHLSLLQQVIQSSPSENLLVRSYSRSFNGFAAKLSDYEAQKLASMKEVVSVFPSRTYQLLTTRSWSFMGFDESSRRNPTVESNVIVGVIDSGVWPESESFDDKGFGPPPKHWRGSCEGGKNFTCNNKIIGARFYDPTKFEIVSARDDLGHGTHTASTAAGNKIQDASFFGIAQGTARGGVPSSRIAAYKVCTAEGKCYGENILAAFDDAVADGVDIITVSIGIGVEDFSIDPIAIGAFHAMEKGIFISHSAGNNGGVLGEVLSVAPWILTVAASSTDREIIDKVVLGNGKTLIGKSINRFALKGENFPLVDPVKVANASAKCVPENTRLCELGCLDASLAKGKIVICDGNSGKTETERVGALGTILPSTKYDDVSFVTSSPSTHLNDDDFGAVKSYINSTSQPVANILKSEAINDSSAPVVASFSSRGPNRVVFDLLKPDVTAPGIDILAAFPTPLGNNRQVKFNIMSGTSMSCPHAAGVAAYVKSFHPEWSPSAIKSAIMTTAFPMNATTTTDAELAYGSGLVNPSKAIDPGLVYDASTEDYILFLCSINRYTDEMVRAISGNNTITCPRGAKKALSRDFNYPSLTSLVPTNASFEISFHRTVTNVGLANSTYRAKVFTNSKLKIKVEPEVLSFKAVNEKKHFVVSAVGEGFSEVMRSASLEWFDGTHVVRSPIVFYIAQYHWN